MPGEKSISVTFNNKTIVHLADDVQDGIQMAIMYFVILTTSYCIAKVDTKYPVSKLFVCILGLAFRKQTV